ncbi:MAG TPA: hypothetical protein VK837_05675 [Longimicrobiales bacterium]|nr:hypothetical protein [Longimicrobiales bacterium]
MPRASRFAVAPLVLGLFAVAGSGTAQEGPGEVDAEASPLAPFDRLIGTWAAGSTVQTFEWGVGRLVVRARSTLVDGDASRLVSEGIFLQDQLRGEVRGYFAAIDMPVAYFEYSARWEGDTLVANLTTTAPEGGAVRYVERWQLLGNERFLWTLHENAAADAPAIMSAEFVRVPPPGAQMPDDGGAGANRDRDAATIERSNPKAPPPGGARR